MHFNDFRLGVLKGDQVVDVTDVVANIPHVGPGDRMNSLIAHFGDFRARLEAAAASGTGVPVGSVRIRPPVPKPTNIECMAVNYMEDGTLKEPSPINAFHKSPGCIISRVSAANAMDHVFGYINFIDGSARGVVPPTNVFYQMKSRATFAPIGPYLVTADEVPDPQKLQVKLWVNGQLKQNFNTDDMAHKIPRCIEWVSHIHDLEPGDIIATGTNHRGLSSFQDGDKIELECEGMGRLAINVKDDLKRTWARETRLERTEKGHEGLTPQLTGKYAKA
jgi:2-keto-4-pentenoate hydratase/2-oxohepta-3-ene-1,7-dioic acid hydratase in catechol pathway